MFLWLTLLYGFKGLLLVFGAFLAWETRKVTLPALNDSKLIGISVYNVVILCVIGVAVSYIMDAAPAALYIFTSSFIIFCTTLTLLVVFVPKMKSVRIYPDGEPMSTMNMPTSTTGNMSFHADPSFVSKDDVIQLETKIKSLLKHILDDGQAGQNLPRTTGDESIASNGSPKQIFKMLIEKVDAELVAVKNGQHTRNAWQ
ncbi:gamma-aminobutyric acid type B receptor subunit 2-like [Amphiura filiformis]|uniref:gamma-aminobutyric acid type B receptor subunit 2-like n=1 Tax=Amphiura filiformis TaxID=82378 RepID=UPI003B227BF9